MRTHALGGWTALAMALVLGSCNDTPAPRGPTGGEEKVASGADLVPGVAIVHTANIRGEVEPCGCGGSHAGGIHRRWNWLEREVPGERLWLDSGDLLTEWAALPPSLSAQIRFKAEILVEAMSEMGLDAMVPGEQDFGLGLAELERLRAKARFHVLAANLYRRDTGERAFEPYAVFVKRGRRIGVIGLYDKDLVVPEGLEARDPIAAAREAVAELRERADVVIALTHLGLQKDRALAAEVPGIDAIFGGHTTYIFDHPLREGGALIFQSGYRGQHGVCFVEGANRVALLDSKYNSPVESPNPMDRRVEAYRRDVPRLTGSGTLAVSPPSPGPLTTFPRCAECHEAQYEFWRGTPHARAFETLVKAGKHGDRECLRCHTLGMDEDGGWKRADALVVGTSGSPIDAGSFASTLPGRGAREMSQVARAYVNVQCESCHGVGAGHPSQRRLGSVQPDRCLRCHTLDRAAGWYRDGRLDEALVDDKLRSVSCPRMAPR